MKASYLILLISCLTLLSYAQIAGAVNEAPVGALEGNNSDKPWSWRSQESPCKEFTGGSQANETGGWRVHRNHQHPGGIAQGIHSKNCWRKASRTCWAKKVKKIMTSKVPDTSATWSIDCHAREQSCLEACCASKHFGHFCNPRILESP